MDGWTWIHAGMVYVVRAGGDVRSLCCPHTHIVSGNFNPALSCPFAPIYSAPAPAATWTSTYRRFQFSISAWLLLSQCLTLSSPT
jgi:hypothetical protein